MSNALWLFGDIDGFELRLELLNSSYVLLPWTLKLTVSDLGVSLLRGLFRTQPKA